MVISFISHLGALSFGVAFILLVINAITKASNKTINDAKLKESTTTNNEQVGKIIAENKIPKKIDDFRIKNKYENLKIAILDFMEVDYSSVYIGNDIELVPEPNNKYDSNAIKVICNNIHCGYIYKGTIQDMIHDFIARKEPIRAVIQNINPIEKYISIYIVFYKKPSTSKLNVINAKLIKTTKKDEYDDRQESYLRLEQDDELSIDYSYESETYVVSNEYGSEIGELNKSVSQKLRELENDYDISVVVDEITENENGKYGATVNISYD